MIKAKLDGVYGNALPSMATVSYWIIDLKSGRTSVLDEKRPGRPADVATEEINQKVHDVILVDRRTKVRDVAEAISVATGMAIDTLRNKLVMKKLSARWVPVPLFISNQCLKQFKRNPKEF